MLRRRSVALACLSLVLAAVGATAAPDAPEALDWRAVGRSSALRWNAPGGDPVATYEVRGAEQPIDEASFDAASPLATYPSGTPRPPGVLEFRELQEVPVGTGEDPNTVLETALYFAVRAIDAGGAAGPVAATDGFDLSRIRATQNRAGLTKLVVKGRFAIRRAALDVTSGDLRVRLLQNGVPLLDETVPASAFTTTTGAIRALRPTSALRLVRFTGGMFALLTVKTERMSFALEPGDVSVLLDLGTRPFAADTTLREKGRGLIAP
jgi:hypothetical protein